MKNCDDLVRYKFMLSEFSLLGNSLAIADLFFLKQLPPLSVSKDGCLPLFPGKKMKIE